MKLVFTDDLSEQKVYGVGEELALILGKDRGSLGERIVTYPDDVTQHVHTFTQPKLVTDTAAIGALPSTLRDTLFTLFGRSRIVEYDGVTTLQSLAYPSVWGPSIDTLLVARGMKRIFDRGTRFERGIELCSASGFLAKYAMSKGGFSDFTVNDISKDALTCAQENMAGLTLNGMQMYFPQGKCLELISGQKYDFVVCNPPYVPRPNEQNGNQYEGVEIVRHLLTRGREYLNKNGMMFVTFSSLTEDALAEDTVVYNDLIEHKEVPLKVNNILNNPVWLQYLVQKCGLQKASMHGYDFWHVVKVAVITN